ncbi:U3 small nucleolar RNA-associated protein 10 [Scedosporium apiospermum]|uniref:U3 small nucleolar RNA-associated protein 10 n=1 Tax=Pseudallescheria apiosperma TaxID=563466 RepID=A0A084GBZ1_PSEDA|nr:U3 small nucleolar RNA-associated protein 10 [Scedosporium apiospermum]KEZ44853.1 U3 small nucleolar RNA-associated protein 10 [Scedosporium apiospermum]
MATSLAKQLAQIAAKSKTTLNAKAQKAAHSKSLIWEPKVAASQSFQSLYPVCYEGFEELCGLDARFTPFRATLFSEQSQYEDRTQLTEAENRELDGKVESFLRLVGSRLRLMPAIKAIEWLIRRFRIHEFNTAFLLTTFLPYHTLPVFITLLSILPSQIPDDYRFLQPYIRSLTPPPRAALVHQTIHHRNFLALISEYTLESCSTKQHYQTLIAFWGGILTEAVNGLVDKNKSGRKALQHDNDQALLHQLGPIFGEALMMKKVPQAQIAAYMALTVFVSKGDFGDAAVSAFMEQLALGWTGETVRPGLVCLSILGQHRSAKQVSGKIAKALLKVPEVEKHLVEIGREWKVDRLANGLCLAMIDRAARKGCARGLPIVGALIRANVLTPKQTSVLFKALLLIGTNLSEEVDKSGSVRKELGSMLVQLSQDPGECGDIIQSAITDVDFDMDQLEMRLDLSLRQSKMLPSTEEGAMDTEDAVEVPKESISDELAKLAQLSGGLASDLGPDAGDAFGPASEVFLRAIIDSSSEKVLHEFDSLPILSREQALTSPTYFVFFMRIWCGTFPALAKAKALEMAKNRLKACENENVDFQALLPYILAALSDPSKKVRQAAADFLIILNKVYSSNTKGAAVWAKTLYPSSQGRDAMNSDAAVKTLQTVFIPALEECVMHQDHVSFLFESAIGPPKSKDADEGKTDRLPPPVRLAFFRFAAGALLRTPFLLVKERLLKALNRVRSVGTTSRTQVLLPALNWWAGLTAEEASELVRKERLDESDLNKRFVGVVVANDSTGLQALMKIVVTSKDTREDFIESIFVRLRNLWPLMRPENKSAIANQMLDLALSGSDAEDMPRPTAVEAAELLRSVKLTTEILSHFLESIHMETNIVVDSPPNKRRRLSNEMTRGAPLHGGLEIAAALKKATFVLQLIELSDPAAHAALLPSLFSTLAKLHTFRAAVGSDLGYLQNVVLTSLHAMLPAYKANSDLKITISDGYGDLLVNCIQKSSSPIVQNAALLLIASLATTAPDVVIHCVMPIFTFMGVSVIRQSDDYSAHVVNQVIKEVVPPLVATLRKGKRSVVAASSELLLSFTSSYEHIPSHRRFGIFMSLVDTLGADEFLFAIIALLVEKQGPTEGVLSFVTELLDRHNVKTQLDTLVKLISLIGDLFKPAPNLASALLRPTSKLDPQVSQAAALNQLSALPALLSSRRLRIQVRKITEHDDMQASEVRELYAGLLENLLLLADAVKAHKELYALCGESLASLLNLLTIGEFIKAVENLLDRPNLGLRQKVLKALETRVNQESSADPSSRAVLLGFLPQLTAAIRDSDDIRYKHTAVACVDKIAEKYGERDLEAVAAAASIIAGEHCLGQPDKHLRVMALLCLASLVSVLGHGVIPVLPSASTYAMNYLRECMAGNKEANAELHNACYFFVLSVVQHMPEMITGSYLEQLLAISNASAEYGWDSEANDSRKSCLKSLATQVTPKTLFTGLSNGWPTAAGAGFKAIAEYIDLIRTAIIAHREQTIRKNVSSLSSIFLNAFDFRRQEFEKGPVNESVSAKVAEIEGSVNEVALLMIHKLNDGTFRPIFSQLIEWTTAGTQQLPKSDTAGHLRRSQSVYGFLYAFFNQLGRIVTSYATYMLDDAVRLLKSANPTKSSEERTLWESVLKVLAKCFEHDEDGFWQSPAHFEAVAPILVEQFRYASSSSSSDLLLTETLTPAIVELARAASSQTHQKELNTSILKLLRSEQASKRLAAVKCQQALANRLGEEWLAMLPEMLPFISELQDDDDEVVERETHRWIVGIEGVLGESLDNMLQ